MRELMGLKVGTLANIDGRVHRYGGFARLGVGENEPSNAVRFVDVITNESRTWLDDEFRELYANARATWPKPYEHGADKPPEPLPDDPSDAERARHQKAHIRQAYLQAYDKEPVSLSDKALRAFVERIAPTIPFDHSRPSPGTLRRIVHGRGEVGDRRLRYMGDRHRRGPKAMRLSPIVEKILGEQAEAVYFSEIRGRPIDVYAEVGHAIGELNKRRVAEGLPPVICPSRTTIWRYLKRHTDYAKATRRYGKRIAQKMFVPIRASMGATRILQTGIIDHTRLDAMAVDDRSELCVGRPWLTLLLDTYSRYPLGFCLTFEPPSVYSAMACIRMGVAPKTDLKKRYPEVDGEWVASGVPETILTDNAWEFTGGSFVDACDDARISIEWCPIGTPECKPIGERFFETLNNLIVHRLPGSAPFTPQRRKLLGIDPAAGAQLTISQMERLIYQCIVEVYGRETHRGIGEAPEVVWRRSEKEAGFHWAEDLPSLNKALAKLGPLRRLDRHGVDFLGKTYRTPENLGRLLAHLIPTAPARGGSEGSTKVKIKYHPEDISRIYVYNPIDDDYVELACTDQEYTRNLSEHQHTQIKKFAAENMLALRSSEDWCAARARLRAAVRSQMPAGRIGDRNRAMRLESAPELMRGDVVERFVSEANDSHLNEYRIPIDTMSSRTDDGVVARAPVPKSRRRKRAAAIEGKSTIQRPSVQTQAAPAPPNQDLDYLAAAIAKMAAAKQIDEVMA